jgi:23S rRNA (uracil-5-)-methyltransferase RumA
MNNLLEKGQEVLITIKRIGINGEGIGYYKRKAIFVDGVMPPEEVVVKIIEEKEKYATAEVVRVKIKAAKRVKPFCKHFGTCGGCQLQHIDYDEQISLKEEMLIQSIERYSGLDVNKLQFLPMITMNNPKYYRHKAQMPVRNTTTGITTGLYKKDTNELVDILECPVHNEKINEINRKVIEILDEFDVRAFDSTSMRGLVRYIVTRVSSATEEAQVTLVITIFNKALVNAAKEIIKIPGVESVGISKNRDVKNVGIFGDEVEILEGKPSIQEGIGEVKYDLKPKAFYQLNPEQAIKLYKYVKSSLDLETDRVIVDAYSGAGAISTYLAPHVDKVLGIDIAKESIYSARHNMKINDIKNIEFEIGEVKDVLPKYYAKGFNPDVIIIDPPRSGIDQQTIDVLLKKVVNKIIYISCNPSTLGKNLKDLSRKYNVVSVTPLDMFPHTSHIESITILKKK